MWSFVTLLCLFLLECCTSGVQATGTNQRYVATAKIYKHLDPTTILGSITFRQTDEAKVLVSGTLSGLSNPNSLHGFHINELGVLGPNVNCSLVGMHYNPEKNDHAGPDDVLRHIGDMGNIQVDMTGTATINFVLPAHKLPLIGPHSIVGRSVIIHSDQDDFGLGGHADSKTTGHAGARYGCGVIGIASSNLVIADSVMNSVKAPVPRSATATLLSPNGKIVYGEVVVQQLTSQSQVCVTGELVNIERPGLHGLHVHVLGNLTVDCSGASTHFNPYKFDHAGPTDGQRHLGKTLLANPVTYNAKFYLPLVLGDLGNVLVDSKGFGLIDLCLPYNDFPLVGPNSIVGRAIVLHADEDDLGRGGFEDSKTTGHAGARLGCGVLGIASDFSPADLD